MNKRAHVRMYIFSCIHKKLTSYLNVKTAAAVSVEVPDVLET